MRGHPEHIDAGPSIIGGGKGGGRHKWREVAGWWSRQTAFYIYSDAGGHLKLVTYVPSVEAAFVAIPPCLRPLRNKVRLWNSAMAFNLSIYLWGACACVQMTWKLTPLESVAMVWSVMRGLLRPSSSLFDIDNGNWEQNIVALHKFGYKSRHKCGVWRKGSVLRQWQTINEQLKMCIY